MLLFIVLTYHRFMGFYYTPSWMALLGMRGLVHGPSKTIQRKLSPGNTEGGNVGARSIVR